MDLLRTRSGEIVDSSGKTVRLEGTFLGGWMNMENWMNGYPGTEHELRETFARELGAERADFIFDRWLHHFFTEADVLFMRESGATAVRIPLNYRHFESDAAPFEYLETACSRQGQRRNGSCVQECHCADVTLLSRKSPCRGQNPHVPIWPRQIWPPRLPMEARLARSTSNGVCCAPGTSDCSTLPSGITRKSVPWQADLLGMQFTHSTTSAARALRCAALALLPGGMGFIPHPLSPPCRPHHRHDSRLDGWWEIGAGLHNCEYVVEGRRAAARARHTCATRIAPRSALVLP